MAWIQIHQHLKDHKKLISAADKLNIEPVSMLGHLVSFWLWALDNATIDGSLEGISNRCIARTAQWTESPDEFVEVITDVGFLDKNDDGILEIHDWREYTGKLIDRRESERLRSQRRRDENRKADQEQTSQQKKIMEQSVKMTQRTENPRKDKKNEKESCEIFEEPVSTEDDSILADSETSATSPYQLCQQVVGLYHEICVSYPKLYELSEQRKENITACLDEYGQNLDVFRKLFEYAESSAFMKGDNKQGWKADFDWMMSADNMAKVLEGKYNDVWKSGAKPTYPDCSAGGVRDNGTRRYMTLGEAKRQKKQFVSFPQGEYDMLALERSLLGVSELSPADCEIVQELPDDDKERASPD